MKKVNKSLYAKWEILSTAEIVETEYKDKPIDDDFFERNHPCKLVQKNHHQ